MTKLVTNINRYLQIFIVLIGTENHDMLDIAVTWRRRFEAAWPGIEPAPESPVIRVVRLPGAVVKGTMVH